MDVMALPFTSPTNGIGRNRQPPAGAGARVTTAIPDRRFPRAAVGVISTGSRLCHGDTNRIDEVPRELQRRLMMPRTEHPC